jgi:hypothetical protein
LPYFVNFLFIAILLPGSEFDVRVFRGREILH